MITFRDIAHQRLISQRLHKTKLLSPEEVVGWLGAVQAQDYHMAKWAIGTRMANATEQLIEDAITKAKIVRTHVMRPTWHFALAEDIGWMLKLTAPHVKAAMKSYQVKLGLSEKIFVRTNGIIEKFCSIRLEFITKSTCKCD